MFAFALGGGEEGDLARDPVILSQVASVTGLSGYAAGSQRALILPGGLIARVFTSSRATPGYTVDGTSSRGNAADHRDSADHQGGGERDEDHSDQQDDSLVAEWAEDSDGDDEDLFGFDAWQQQQMAV